MCSSTTHTVCPCRPRHAKGHTNIKPQNAHITSQAHSVHTVQEDQNSGKTKQCHQLKVPAKFNHQGDEHVGQDGDSESSL